MILFLLENRRLRFPLFVGLLLVLGTIPERSEGLQCHKCKDDNDNVCTEIETCEEGLTSCTSVTFDGETVGRSCTHGKVGQCLVDIGYASKGSPCGIIPFEGFPQEYQDKVSACVGEPPQKMSARSAKGRQAGLLEIKQCVCDTDLCNVEKLMDTPMPNAGPNQQHDQRQNDDQSTTPSSQQQQTSNSKLIFAILTAAAFYNYI